MFFLMGLNIYLLSEVKMLFICKYSIVLMISLSLIFSGSPELRAAGQISDHSVASSSMLSPRLLVGSALLVENFSDKINSAKSSVAEIPYIESPLALAEFLESAIERGDADKLDKAEISSLVENVFQLEPETRDFLLESVMTPLIHPAPAEQIGLLFGDNFASGTFMLSERLQTLPFLFPSDNVNLRAWVHQQVSSELVRMRKTKEPQLRWLEMTDGEFGLSLEDRVFLFLFLRGEDGMILLEKIPNQIFQDVFLRIISTLVWRHQYAWPHADAAYNDNMKDIAFAMLPQLTDLSLRDLFSYTVTAGVMGLDMKSVASAASLIDRSADNFIRYYNGEESEAERLERMFTDLQRKAERPFAIDSWADFEQQIVNARHPVQLTWFHDDVGETIFDLFFIMRLLQHNSNITVVSVPRSDAYAGIRYGNDASSVDFFAHFLTHPRLMPLFRIMIEEQRFRFSREGPCWGAVIGPELSSEVVEEVLRSEAIVVKGARSHETLNGINKDAYFAQAVCREMSESITGVDGKTGMVVFAKQEAGLPTFQGFRSRHQRSEPLIGTGRHSWAVSMTVREYVDSFKSAQYKNLLGLFHGDRIRLNKYIKTISEKTGLTIAQVIHDFEKVAVTLSVSGNYDLSFERAI